ncbi:glycosyltransferase family 61 protein [Methylobacterium flocculans]|uniref:glycosyltransferase family 61 protein n=1 Tax=Methylobacterium flocculans TaxID=2984843 RepID=UPI0021F37A0C|nr:glycosyltransferase family 61 protein [Methylobacterium sp. FF17]
MIIDRILSCEEIISGDSAENSASVVSELLPEHQYTREQPFYIDITKVNSEVRASLEQTFSQKVSALRKIHLFSFRQGVVFGQGSVVTANSALIRDSVAEFINHNLAPEGSTASGTSFKIDNFDNLRCLHGTSVLVKRPWYRNYGHWLVDLMPILPLLEKGNFVVNNIIFGDVPEGNLKLMMEKSAALLYPTANVVFAGDHEVLKCEQLYYVRPVHVPPLFKHPDAITQSVELSRKLFPSSSSIKHKRVYISRNKTNTRRIVNEEELTSVLSANGFVTIYPESMNISEQIAIFENSEVTIGVKGAAFTNSIFCNKNCHIVLLSPPRFTDPFFWDLISQRGIKFSEIYCREPDNQTSTDISNTDLHVNMESISALMKLL